ncbi:MAG: hypothetical protein AAGF06_02255 [Pseudomonadota bacterium]
MPTFSQALQYLKVLPLVVVLQACGGDTKLGDSGSRSPSTNPPPVTTPSPGTPKQFSLHTAAANQCYAVKSNSGYLSHSNNAFSFENVASNAAQAFLFRPTDLGVYLLFDTQKRYVTTRSNALNAQTNIASEVSTDIDELEFIKTPAEWELQTADNGNTFRLYNPLSKTWISTSGTTSTSSNALMVSLEPKTGCATFPESEVNATYSKLKTQFDDGSLFGYADAHEHLFTDFSGPQGFIAGHSFHKLGIEHALPNCDKYHGAGGSKDVLGVAFGTGGGDASIDQLLPLFQKHLLAGEPHHDTSGYPNFSFWPEQTFKTHQQMYYKWLERAWLSGMRLLVDYTVMPQVQCDLLKTLTPKEAGNRSCNEMDGVDRHLTRVKELERYIDAQNGGEGQGWFQIAYTPQEARNIASEGKLAVILGMEVENPLNCFRRAREGFPLCTKEVMEERLDTYYAKGIRALFPVHKFANGFAAGDGAAGVLEIGDFLNTNGEWRDYVPCDSIDSPAFGTYEGGQSMFNSIISFASNSIFSSLNNLLSFVGIDSPLPAYEKSEKHCVRDGLTPLGKDLLGAMINRGMIIDTGHFTSASYKQSYEIFENRNYPPVDTHHNTFDSQLMKLGGFTNGSLNSNCRGDDTPVGHHYLKMLSKFEAVGNPDATLGLGYDFNGLSDYAYPRYGDNAKCKVPQAEADKLTYPFTSYGGDVVFDKLTTGNKTFDFNFEGLSHVGMLPDAIQDLRNGGVTDEKLQPLFKSADGYIKMWERMQPSK